MKKFREMRRWRIKLLMSPPLLGGEEEGKSNGSMDCISHNGSGLKELNYHGLSDCSSVNSSVVSNLSEGNKNNLNLRLQS
ncbi:hypothetical protein DVH24_030244 [Malus domestica]|uniref:Uncharacterized protein n=1 Tax=Malus domestica TaxID=3750 RepID=A0A498I380_MALDO|nr:hypothetical protein DVH24_030244 [Malus domestica]